MSRLSDPVLSEMRLMRQEAERLLIEHRKLLPRYSEVAIGGAYIDSLSRGEALHMFLDSLGLMSPEKALEVAKKTSQLFLFKHNERFSRDYVTQRSAEQDYSFLVSCYRRIKRAAGEPLTEVVNHFERISHESEKMTTKWQPIECRDNDPERVYWRIFRHNPETKTREYGLTDEKGVLEFVNREQAQSVCDSWNGPLDYTPCASRSTYIYADNSAIKVKAREKKAKAILRSRVGPGALAAILANDDDD